MFRPIVFLVGMVAMGISLPFLDNGKEGILPYLCLYGMLTAIFTMIFLATRRKT